MCTHSYWSLMCAQNDGIHGPGIVVESLALVIPSIGSHADLLPFSCFPVKFPRSEPHCGHSDSVTTFLTNIFYADPATTQLVVVGDHFSTSPTFTFTLWVPHKNSSHNFFPSAVDHSWSGFAYHSDIPATPPFTSHAHWPLIQYSICPSQLLMCNRLCVKFLTQELYRNFQVNLELY